MRTVPRAQLQEKVVGLVSLEKLETLDPFIQRKHRPGIVELGRRKFFFGHIVGTLVSPKIITTDDRKSKRLSGTFTNKIGNDRRGESQGGTWSVNR